MRLLSVAALLLLGAGLQAADFTTTMTPAEQAASGLDKLTPAELAVLKSAVERYKSGEVAAVRQEADQKVAQAEARAEEKSKEERKRGYLAGLFNQGAAKEEVLVESTLPGRHQNFQGRPIYTLANGQRWAVVETARYFATRPLQDPKVMIEPGAMGSFWMAIEGGPRLRVKPVIESGAR
jgi:hypothetical protein